MQGVLRDLVALIAMPTAWAARGPADVIGATLDILVATLRLEFAAAEVDSSVTGSTFKTARLPRRRGDAGNVRVLTALEPWFSPASELPGVIANPVGEKDIVCARYPLGIRGDVGTVIVASTREDFPTVTERLLLNVAINHAAMSLQESRRLAELERITLLNAQQASMVARFDATLEERTRIAREMHDTLLQGFTGLTLHLAALSRESALSSDVRSALVELTKLAQRTLTAGRQAVWGLRMSPFGDLAEELQRLAAEGLRASGIDLRCEVTGPSRTLGETGTLAALRILQEALANVVKHAGAQAVLVRIAFEPEDFSLTIADNGSGFSVEPDLHPFGGHWGLIGMRERASEAGGSLVVQSRVGSGTEITARLPYRGE